MRRKDVELIELMTTRTVSHKVSIKEMQATCVEIDKKITSLRQPIENLDGLVNSYNYFWTVWQDMKSIGRRRAIKQL
jgi:hypothetical protein